MTRARGYCSTLQHTATHCSTLQQTRVARQLVRRVPQQTATHCNALQHTRVALQLVRTVPQHSAINLDSCAEHTQHTHQNTLQLSSTRARHARTHTYITHSYIARSSKTLYNCPRLVRGTRTLFLMGTAALYSAAVPIQKKKKSRCSRLVRGTRTYAHTRALALIHVHTHC